MKKNLLLAVSAIGIAAVSHAQQWTQRYNGTGNGADAIKAMAVDNSGNVYVTGASNSGANDNDYITVKYNSAGMQQWLARYNGSGNGSDVPNSICIDNAGNVYVTGSSDQLTGAFINNDIATVKYSPQGAQLWVARYDGARQRDDAGTAVKTDAAGNVYVTGYTTVRNAAYTKKDYVTIKYNSAGSQLWIATYNGPANGDDAAVGLGLDPSGNVYVTGTSFAGNDPLGEQDYLTIKYDANGVQKWTARYNGPISEPDVATGIAVDNSGNAYVTGYSTGNDLDFATVKYNTNGVQQWVARYDGAAHGADLAYAIALDNSGNVYVTGSDQATLYNSDFRTIKYNAAGIQQWSAAYNGPANDNDEALALAVDANGNVCVTGYVNGTSPSWDIATVKYAASGAQQWVKRYDGPGHGNDAGYAVAIDGIGNVIVTGGSDGRNTSSDFVTIKYSASGARMKPVTEEAPEALSQNYPNPFSGLTTVEYHLVKSADVMFSVFDISGQLVKETRIGSQQPGNHSAEMDGTSLPAGFYYYRMSAGDITETKKMMIVK